MCLKERLRRASRSDKQFIPANAGNSCPVGPGAARPAVHPRERGEQFGGHFSQPVRPRFIPANAGNRLASFLWVSTGTVHPRERGEQRRSLVVIVPSGGSSPRTRGTAPIFLPSPIRGRFIPANAGNSTWTPCPASRPPVHPRERGEQQAAHEAPVGFAGSSPRTRGTGKRAKWRAEYRRFIPANAGNSEH